MSVCMYIYIYTCAVRDGVAAADASRDMTASRWEDTSAGDAVKARELMYEFKEIEDCIAVRLRDLYLYMCICDMFVYVCVYICIYQFLYVHKHSRRENFQCCVSVRLRGFCLF